MGVLVADFPVAAVDDEFGVLVTGDFPARVDGAPLRFVDRSDAAIALAANGPGIGMRHNVLILPAHFACPYVFG